MYNNRLMRTSWKTQAILARLQADLDALQQQSQFRQVGKIAGINLCSNDYLALSDDPRLRQAVIAALQRQDLALCSTGSRLLSGNSPAWEEFESRAAAFTGAEAALAFSSGYMANIGLLASIAGPESTVFSDSANHASIIDGLRLSRARKVIFPHNDLQGLEDRLKADTGSQERIIVVESIFSMDGDLAPLQELYGLADKYDAGIIVDEAHATGVVGPQGRGLVAQSGRPDCVIASVHTCGKALAAMGAFVACSQTLRQYLVNMARTFIFSTALAPHAAIQATEALSLASAADDRRHHLQALAATLRRGLNERGFDTSRSASHIVPVILGSNDRALRTAESLSAQGFGVKAVRPPTVPAGTSRLRLSLTARLTHDQVNALLQAIGAAN